MLKGLRIFSLLFILAAGMQVYAQDAASTEQKDKNPYPIYEPKSVINRLSYENFRSIKLLTAAIMNFGGGEAEFNRIVDSYAEASALFFNKDFRKSAESFIRNEREISDTAMKLAEQYKKDAMNLQKNIIAHSVRERIKASLAGKQPNQTADKLVTEASEAVGKANDLYVRTRPIEAIQFYRKAKEKALLYYQVANEKLPEGSEKDMSDNKNKVYVAKEKKN